MNSRMHGHPSLRGFTLVELTLVISIIVVLVTVGLKANTGYKNWRLAREASDTLLTVYVAQRTYLADNPTTPVSSLTHELLLPYIQNSPATFPTATSLTGDVLNIYVGESPPSFTTTGTTTGATPPSRYDPSDSYTDTLWDVGE